jgi:uncharacterized protein (TIGR02996 family)
MTESHIVSLSEDCRNLLAACKAASKDDVPRLVLADAVQEAGDEDLGQYIRLSCEWARVWREPGGYRYKVFRVAARLHDRLCRRNGWEPVPPNEAAVRKAAGDAAASPAAFEATVAPVRGVAATLRFVRGFAAGVHVDRSPLPGPKPYWSHEPSGPLWFGRCRLCEMHGRLGRRPCEYHGEAGPAPAGPALVAEHPFLCDLSFVSVRPTQVRGREAEGWWWLMGYGPQFSLDALPEECSDFWPDDSVDCPYRLVTSECGVTYAVHRTAEGGMRNMSSACIAWARAALSPTCESGVPS